ncbi:hypothetical protein CHCC20335_0944 [Bacillus paralicheniformis]|nr:hypothetical protein CHCC20335_0944 [Bacillus paralicheniformis]
MQLIFSFSSWHYFLNVEIGAKAEYPMSKRPNNYGLKTP